MNESLLQIVVNLVSFLAHSDDDTVDQDAAVEQLEHVAATLKQMSPVERDQLLAFIEAEAARSEDHERSKFLRSLPDQLGLLG